MAKPSHSSLYPLPPTISTTLLLWNRLPGWYFWCLTGFFGWLPSLLPILTVFAWDKCARDAPAQCNKLVQFSGDVLQHYDRPMAQTLSSCAQIFYQFIPAFLNWPNKSSKEASAIWYLFVCFLIRFLGHFYLSDLLIYCAYHLLDLCHRCHPVCHLFSTTLGLWQDFYTICCVVFWFVCFFLAEKLKR